MSENADAVIHQQMLMIAAQEQHIQEMHKEIATLRPELTAATTDLQHSQSIAGVVLDTIGICNYQLLRWPYDATSERIVLEKIDWAVGAMDTRDEDGFLTLVACLKSMLAYIEPRQLQKETLQKGLARIEELREKRFPGQQLKEGLLFQGAA